MYLQRTGRKIARFSGVQPRYRGEPEEDHRDREDEVAGVSQACAEVHRLFGVAEPVHQSVGRESFTLVPADEEIRPLPVVTSGGRSLAGVEEDAILGTDLGFPSAEGAYVVICGGIKPSGQCGDNS